MLIKVTNYCSMGCSHCMEESTIKGGHMSEETFVQAMRFTLQAEALAYAAGYPPLLLFSGGECTEHPDILHFIELAMEWGFIPMLITNGMWLNNKQMRESILRPAWKRKIRIQVTNDPRYYPTAPTRVEDERITYIEAITTLLPLGRAARKKGAPLVPVRQAPSSFNFRSLARGLGSFEKAVAALRFRFLEGKSGSCTPNITEVGDVLAGESRNCFKIGTIYSTHAELTENLLKMRCNECGLVDNLTQEQKRAIGESVLFDANGR